MDVTIVGMFNGFSASAEKTDSLILTGLELCQVTITEGTEMNCKRDKEKQSKQINKNKKTS